MGSNTEPLVTVNVTLARRRVAREAITVDGPTWRLNPGQASALAADLAAAAEIVDRYMPPLELVTPASTPFAEQSFCAQTGHCVNNEHSCAIDAGHDDHRSHCCHCGGNLPEKADA